MTTVKFATLCDLPAPPGAGRLLCEARSEEYTSWPSCRGCVAHVCPEHTVPGSQREEGDEDQAVTVYCTGCLPQRDVCSVCLIRWQRMDLPGRVCMRCFKAKGTKS